MKLLGVLPFLLVLAPSVASLRGKSPYALTDEASEVGERILGSDAYVYKEFQGVCRKNSDGTGSGSVGKEYSVYKRADNPDVNFEWCKEMCDGKSDCTGIEYRDSGVDSQCEVWTKDIKGYKSQNGHICLVRVERCHYYEWNWGSCRKYSDGSGTGNNGDEYDLYKGKSYSWCEETCSENAECKGFEYSWSPENIQCEIWTTEIKGVKPKNDLECNKKVYC